MMSNILTAGKKKKENKSKHTISVISSFSAFLVAADRLFFRNSILAIGLVPMLLNPSNTTFRRRFFQAIFRKVSHRKKGGVRHGKRV